MSMALPIPSGVYAHTFQATGQAMGHWGGSRISDPWSTLLEGGHCTLGMKSIS